MTATQSIDAPEPSEWMPVWVFAKTIASKTCFAATWWIQTGGFAGTDQYRSEIWLRKKDPNLFSAAEKIISCLRPEDDAERAVGAVWHNSSAKSLLEREIDRRRNRRWNRAHHLLSTKIPALVRQRLLAGGYEVVSRTDAGADIKLNHRDLSGLQVDLANSALVGDGTVYSAVRVRLREACLDLAVPPHETPAASASPKQDQRGCFNADQARALAAAAKVANKWPAAPTEPELQTFLLQNFRKAPRSAVRDILTERWPGRPRGRRKKNGGLPARKPL